MIDVKSDYIFRIKDLELYLLFYPQSVKIHDLSTKNLLKEIPIDEDYDEVEPIDQSNFSFLLKKNDKEIYIISFKLLRKVTSIKTKAEYILQLGSSENTYYYVGLYEFGTFKLTNHKMFIEKTVETESTSYGIFNQRKKTFYICKGLKTIESWDWSEIPRLLWKLDEISAIKGLTLNDEGILIAGTQEGLIKLINEDGNIIKTFSFEKEPIRHLFWYNNSCICLTNENFVYDFTLDGKLLWKFQLDKNIYPGPTSALTINKNKIYITTYKGNIIELDLTGNLISNFEVTKENFSPLAIFFDKWVVYTSPERVDFSLFSGNSNSSQYIFFHDKMVRALTVTTDGVIVGDDYGEISLLKRPGVKITKVKNIEKFSSFNP